MSTLQQQMHAWDFQRKDGTFVRLRGSRAIEQAFQRGHPAVKFPVNQQDYRIDFQTMVLTNLASRHESLIRRVKVNACGSAVNRPAARSVVGGIRGTDHRHFVHSSKGNGTHIPDPNRFGNKENLRMARAHLTHSTGPPAPKPRSPSRSRYQAAIF